MEEEYVVVLTIEGRAGMDILSAVKVKASNGEAALLAGAKLCIKVETEKPDEGMMECENCEDILNDVKETLEKCRGGYMAGSDEFMFISTRLRDGTKEA